MCLCVIFFYKQRTAYELRISGWSSDVCSSDLLPKADIDNYTALFMAPFMAQLLSGLGGHFRPMFNLTVSNVPGPDRPLYFNGAKMEQMYPVSLLAHGQALNLPAVSYAGQFNAIGRAQRRTPVTNAPPVY